MKLALFSPFNILAGYYSLGGYVNFLRNEGHEVLDVSFPGNCYVKNSRNPAEVRWYPTIEDINSCDGVVLTYLEHISGWLETIYGIDDWERQVKVPVVARFDESFDRADLKLPERWPELKRWAQHYSFPAAQDAEKFGGDWLVYGADKHAFPTPERVHAKPYGLGFIGSMYNLRQQYAMQLLPQLGDISFHSGPVTVRDLSGYRIEEQTALLAENYQQIKVFFCLPPMSSLIVAKVFDVMSCGTFVMYPRLKGEAEKNLCAFDEGKEIVYYEFGDFKDNADTIRYYLENENEREQIAWNGRKKVDSTYTLKAMFDRLLAPIRQPVTVN